MNLGELGNWAEERGYGHCSYGSNDDEPKAVLLGTDGKKDYRKSQSEIIKLFKPNLLIIGEHKRDYSELASDAGSFETIHLGLGMDGEDAICDRVTNQSDLKSLAICDITYLRTENFKERFISEEAKARGYGIETILTSKKPFITEEEQKALCLHSLFTSFLRAEFDSCWGIKGASPVHSILQKYEIPYIAINLDGKYI